jgi:hypothetical protein
MTHFAANLRPFLPHVPGLIPRMEDLDCFDFRKPFIQSLMSSFRYLPNCHCVESMNASLVRLPSLLFGELLRRVEEYELELAQFAFGGWAIAARRLSSCECLCREAVL